MLIPALGSRPRSPRVRELSQELQKTIEGFQRRYPMTPAEIRQALWEAGWPWRPVLMRHTVARTLVFWAVVIGLPLILARACR